MTNRTRMPTDKAPLLVTFSLWTLVAASATAWSLSVWRSDQRPAISVQPSVDSGFLITASVDGISRLMGHQPTDAVAMQPESVDATGLRLKLLGVAKAGSSRAVALIAVDGQAAKPVRLGEEVLPGWVLQSVENEQVVLGTGLQTTPSLVLPMPKRP